MSSWRTGRTVGNTIYHGDRFIGSAVTPEDAAMLVDTANQNSSASMQELCRQLRNDQQPSEKLLTAALGPEDTSPGLKGRDFEQMAEDFLKESGCSVDIDPQDFDVIASDLAVRFKEVYEQGQKSK